MIILKKKQVKFELDPPNNNPELWDIELGIIIMPDYHNIPNQKICHNFALNVPNFGPNIFGQHKNRD